MQFPLTNWISITLSKLVQAVTLLTCIQEVLSSNLSWDPIQMFFVDFLIPANRVSHITPKQLASTSLSIYWIVFLMCDAIKCECLKASQNKLWMCIVMSITKPNLLIQVRKIIHLFWQPYKPYQYAVRKPQKFVFNIEEKNLNANCIIWWLRKGI